MHSEIERVASPENVPIHLNTIKILKIGTPYIITVIALQME